MASEQAPDSLKEHVLYLLHHRPGGMTVGEVERVLGRHAAKRLWDLDADDQVHRDLTPQGYEVRLCTATGREAAVWYPGPATAAQRLAEWEHRAARARAGHQRLKRIEEHALKEAAELRRRLNLPPVQLSLT